MTPKEVLTLVDRKDVEKTLANLITYRKEKVIILYMLCSIVQLHFIVQQP